MHSREIAEKIFWVGLDDKKTELFEGIWPIADHGVSLNSYLILDQKKALIDVSSELLSDEFIGHLSELIAPQDLDYIILNHLEPDHTGALLKLLKLAPQAEILGTAKAKEILSNFLGVQEGFRTVADGETLALGANTLKFAAVPFVHWPETMVTYAIEKQILFACDAFGGYGTLDGKIFDDECDHLPLMEAESLRYYANIVAAHSKNAKNAIAKLSGIPIKIVAPSHGLIWRKDPMRILALYSKWSDYPESGAENGITLLVASMYGNTARFATALTDAFLAVGWKPEVFDVTKTHVSYPLASMWKNKGIIVCAPTYETSLFPTMVNVLNMAKIKRIANRTSAYFGSYGWGSMAKKQFETFCTEQKWQIVENMQFYGTPKPAQFEILPDFVKRFIAELQKEA